MFPGGPGRRLPAPSLLKQPPNTTRRLIKYLTDLLLRLFNLFIMASSQGGFKETLQPLNYNLSDSIYIPLAMGVNRVKPTSLDPRTSPLLSPPAAFPVYIRAEHDPVLQNKNNKQ